ncbi:nuclear transport factor 2 family protein [Chelatococcus sp. GCM10030263]|uniref:nuclear transport factor 2 family protein n=1 Tax=Chelatococcus sp. GCM10030263 TaxID=3273387 RepID=UPI0036109803
MHEATSSVSMLEEEERRRCAALMAGDAETLAAMLTDDLVHIHLTGKIDDKVGYLEGFRTKYLFRDVERGPLNIRIWGDCAVMVGTLTQKVVVKETGATHDIRAVTTQTWLRIGGRWLQSTCHNAPLTA